MLASFPQTIAKPVLIRNKLMLCVWWDWKGIIHYELLPLDKTINLKLYCKQLMRFTHEVEKTTGIDQQKGFGRDESDDKSDDFDSFTNAAGRHIRVPTARDMRYGRRLEEVVSA
ncbi:Mariner Mos1 transposase [Eumeta japonica]|uniref:Mariner Mos1 transposase n=1 Tax=Eumeta variegata TaxID=151549 RepID=A0A4C1Z7L9_EUMVA|nr:Mariner Mos1 transposase [Eumeta japonica]